MDFIPIYEFYTKVMRDLTNSLYKLHIKFIEQIFYKLDIKFIEQLFTMLHVFMKNIFKICFDVIFLVTMDL